MERRRGLALGILIASGALGAGCAAAPAISRVPQDPPPAAAADTRWSLGGQAYTFLVPDDGDYVQLAVTADRGPVHLEARHNYEDLDTTSVWVGYGVSGGEALAWTLTPILGGVFGQTDGVGVGYELDLGWRRLSLYSESEYVFDSNDSSDNFFYTWSELSLAATERLRLGLVIQRTKVYDTDFDINRGLLIGLSFERFELIAHALNLDDDPVWVFALAAGL